MKKAYLFIISLTFLAILSGCQDSAESKNTKASDAPSLTIYSGITMVKPLRELARQFEQQSGIDIHIEQGASGYLYKTIKLDKTGDIYFPGSEKFRQQNTQDKLLTDHVLVGFNRLSLIVPKGNPKKLTADLSQLYDPKISVVLASPDSSAVGKATSNLLKDLNICGKVFENITYFTTDSHRLMKSITDQDADLTVNWYATTRWEENINKVDAIALPPAFEGRQKLEMNLLSFSKNPELAKKFMQFASSEHGLRTFAAFGFLTDDELQKLLANPQAFAD